MNIQKSISIVTGASTGIGREVAFAISREGSTIALVGRNINELKITEQLIISAGGKAEIFVADLNDDNQIINLVQTIRAKLGKIDILVNAAGVWHDDEKAFYGKRLFEIPISQVREVLAVNLTSTILLCRTVLPDMIDLSGGKIINFSGTFAGGGANWLPYYVSKKAVEELTVALAEEMRLDNIQVNCISPSDVATPSLTKFFPKDIKYALAPADVAKLVIFLLSNEVAEHITGQVIVIKKNGTQWITGHTQ